MNQNPKHKPTRRVAPWKWVLLAAAIGLCFGCGEEETRISLGSVGSSPAGHLATTLWLDTEESPVLIAPAGDRLFARGVEDDAWTSHPATWPASVDSAGLGLFDTVASAKEETMFSAQRYFVAFDDRIWTIALPAAGQAPMLLYSDEPGQPWFDVELPDELDERATPAQGRSAVVPSIHLLNSDGKLYLSDGLQLWQMEAADNEIGWNKVSLAGTTLDLSEAGDEQGRQFERRELPVRLRHYIAADDGETGDYELATFYGKKLEVFRRDAGDEEFVKASSVDVVDRSLLRTPDGETVYLVGAESLYRSEDGAYTWEELDVSRYSLAPEDYDRLQIVEDQELPSGYTAWLVGDAGSLWRSTDGGDEWDDVLERDSDGRELTGLVAGQNPRQWWASTAGRGMIYSDDDGDQWQQMNAGLDAGKNLVAGLPGGGTIYVGTDAGLFERSTNTRRQDWEPVSRRATSALYVDPEERRLVTGTLGGGISVRTEDQAAESSEAASLGEIDGIEFRPPHMQQVKMSRSAIVALSPRPGSRDIIAWSHRRGPMISNDGGSSWRHLQLGDAFRSALESAVVTQFLTTADQTYFAITQSRLDSAPTQLWRSPDGGTTWQATYSIRAGEEQTPMQLARLPGEQGLVMSYGSRLATSTDMGETWTTVSGPWESGVVTGIAVDGEQMVVAMNLPHTSELAWIDGLPQGARVTRRHRIDWPASRGVHADRPVALEVNDDEVLIQKEDQIYSGSVPRRATGAPDSTSLVLAVGAIILLVSMAFGYLRTWESG